MAEQPKKHPDRGALLSAWFGQRGEWSKSILAIASAGAGIAVNSVLTKSDVFHFTTTVCLVLAAVTFVSCVHACLDVFLKNAELIQLHLDESIDRSVEIAECEDDLRKLSVRQNDFLKAGMSFLIVAYLTHTFFK